MPLKSHFEKMNQTQAKKRQQECLEQMRQEYFQELTKWFVKVEIKERERVSAKIFHQVFQRQAFSRVSQRNVELFKVLQRLQEEQEKQQEPVLLNKNVPIEVKNMALSLLKRARWLSKNGEEKKRILGALRQYWKQEQEIEQNRSKGLPANQIDPPVLSKQDSEAALDWFKGWVLRLESNELGRILSEEGFVFQSEEKQDSSLGKMGKNPGEIERARVARCAKQYLIEQSQPKQNEGDGEQPEYTSLIRIVNNGGIDAPVQPSDRHLKEKTVYELRELRNRLNALQMKHEERLENVCALVQEFECVKNQSGKAWHVLGEEELKKSLADPTVKTIVVGVKDGKTFFDFSKGNETHYQENLRLQGYLSPVAVGIDKKKNGELSVWERQLGREIAWDGDKKGIDNSPEQAVGIEMTQQKKLVDAFKGGVDRPKLSIDSGLYNWAAMSAIDSNALPTSLSILDPIGVNNTVGNRYMVQYARLKVQWLRQWLSDGLNQVQEWRLGQDQVEASKNLLQRWLHADASRVQEKTMGMDSDLVDSVFGWTPESNLPAQHPVMKRRERALASVVHKAIESEAQLYELLGITELLYKKRTSAWVREAVNKKWGSSKKKNEVQPLGILSELVPDRTWTQWVQFCEMEQWEKADQEVALSVLRSVLERNKNGALTVDKRQEWLALLPVLAKDWCCIPKSMGVKQQEQVLCVTMQIRRWFEQSSMTKALLDKKVWMPWIPNGLVTMNAQIAKHILSLQSQSKEGEAFWRGFIESVSNALSERTEGVNPADSWLMRLQRNDWGNPQDPSVRNELNGFGGWRVKEEAQELQEEQLRGEEPEAVKREPSVLQRVVQNEAALHQISVQRVLEAFFAQILSPSNQNSNPIGAAIQGRDELPWCIMQTLLDQGTTDWLRSIQWDVNEPAQALALQVVRVSCEQGRDLREFKACTSANQAVAAAKQVLLESGWTQGQYKAYLRGEAMESVQDLLNPKQLDSAAQLRRTVQGFKGLNLESNAAQELKELRQLAQKHQWDPDMLEWLMVSQRSPLQLTELGKILTGEYLNFRMPAHQARAYDQEYQLFKREQPYLVKNVIDRVKNFTQEQWERFYNEEVIGVRDWLQQERPGWLLQNLGENRLGWNQLSQWQQRWHAEVLAGLHDVKNARIWAVVSKNPILSNELFCAQEISSIERLVEEGQTMQHCVSSYGEQMRNGSSRIVHVSNGLGAPLATVQIKLYQKGVALVFGKGDPNAASGVQARIVQCLGKYNSQVLPGNRAFEEFKKTLEKTYAKEYEKMLLRKAQFQKEKGQAASVDAIEINANPNEAQRINP